MYLVIDCETTGLPKDWRAPLIDAGNWPRVVQVAWMLHDELGRPIESMACLVRPDGFMIPVDAQRIHGITTDRAMAEGRPLASVLEELGIAADRSTVVVAHNIEFDCNIISAEYVRLGLSPPFDGKSLVCTMKGTTSLCRLPGRYGYKWPTLPELHRVLFGHDCSEAHDAASDVVACAKCFFELKRRQVVA
jgi:DNA polymerase-3 subunit epsilon